MPPVLSCSNVPRLNNVTPSVHSRQCLSLVYFDLSLSFLQLQCHTPENAGLAAIRPRLASQAGGSDIATPHPFAEVHPRIMVLCSNTLD